MGGRAGLDAPAPAAGSPARRGAVPFRQTSYPHSALTGGRRDRPTRRGARERRAGLDRPSGGRPPGHAARGRAAGAWGARGGCRSGAWRSCSGAVSNPASATWEVSGSLAVGRDEGAEDCGGEPGRRAGPLRSRIFRGAARGRRPGPAWWRAEAGAVAGPDARSPSDGWCVAVGPAGSATTPKGEDTGGGPGPGGCTVVGFRVRPVVMVRAAARRRVEGCSRFAAAGVAERLPFPHGAGGSAGRASRARPGFRGGAVES